MKAPREATWAVRLGRRLLRGIGRVVRVACGRSCVRATGTCGNRDRRESDWMSRVGVLAHALSAVEAVEREARRLWVELVALEGRLVDAGGRAEELRQLVEEMGERLVAAAEAAAARQVRALAAEAAAAGLDEEAHVTQGLSARETADGAVLARLPM